SVTRPGPTEARAREPASAVRAGPPPAIRPAAPSAASTPPVDSNNSASSSPTPINATTTKRSILRLSAFGGGAERVAFDVGPQRRLVGVGALFEVDELAAAIVEGGVGDPLRAAERVGDLLVRVGVARVGDRRLFEEGVRRVVGVFVVDAEEGNPFAVLRRRLLEAGELKAARSAPRGPDVDPRRIPVQRRDPPFVGVLAAGQ